MNQKSESRTINVRPKNAFVSTWTMQTICDIYTWKKMKNEMIVKPNPMDHFVRKRILYIPVDSSSNLIEKTLRKIAWKEKKTPMGSYFLLKDKTVLIQCIGAPVAVLSLERLIVSGAQEIVILGFCGAIKAEARISDAVSITKAISEEGTSRHYLPRKKCFSPSLSLKNTSEKIISQVNLPFLNGTIVSTDAPYRETQSWLAKKKTAGIDFVDMETSAVFALAEFKGIKAAGVMLVSDKLTETGHKVGFNKTDLNESVKKYFLPFIHEEIN